MTNTPERLNAMVRPETSDYLGEASPGLMFGVVGTALGLMFALVASCWLV